MNAISHHSSQFTKLTLSGTNIEEDVQKLATKIICSMSTANNTYFDVIDLMFRIPSSELEKYTQNISKKIIALLIRLGTSQVNEDNNLLRIRLLELLSFLNFRFSNMIETKDILMPFMKLVSDGSIQDMAGAVKILRHSFESSDPTSSNVLLNIGHYSVHTADKRFKWLVENASHPDPSYYFPFLTLLTVLSFCAKSFEVMHDPICKLFLTLQNFLNDNPQKPEDFAKYLPIISIKARICHSMMLAIDNPARDLQFAFLIDSYFKLSEVTPTYYQTLKDEIGSSFVLFLSQRNDEPRLERIIKNFDRFISTKLIPSDIFYSSISISSKVSDLILQNPKLNYDQITHFAISITEHLFSFQIPKIARCQRFNKFALDIINRIDKDAKEPSLYFDLVFGVSESFKILQKAVDEIKFDHKKDATDQKGSQQLIIDVAYVFDVFTHLVEIIFKVFKGLEAFKVKREKQGVKACKIALPLEFHQTYFMLDTIVSLLLTIIQMRVKWHECNLKFTQKPITSNYKTITKSCINHIKYAKYYERIRHNNLGIFKLIVDLLSHISPSVQKTIWNRFISAFIANNMIKSIDASFIRSIFTNALLFSPFFHVLVNYIINEFSSVRACNDVLPIGCLVIEKLLEVPQSVIEVALGSINEVLIDTKRLVAEYKNYFSHLWNFKEALSFLTLVLKYIAVVLKKLDFLTTIIDTGLVTCICSNAQIWPLTYGNTFVHFIYFCDKMSPKSVENSTVIAALLKTARYEPLNSLRVIWNLIKRKISLFSIDDCEERIVQIAMNSWEDADEKNRLLILKILKRFNTDFIINPKPFCRFKFSNGIEIDAEKFLHSLKENISIPEYRQSFLFLLKVMLEQESYQSSKNNFTQIKKIDDSYLTDDQVILDLLKDSDRHFEIEYFQIDPKEIAFRLLYELGKDQIIITTNSIEVKSIQFSILSSLKSNISQDMFDLSIIKSKEDFNLFFLTAQNAKCKYISNYNVGDILFAEMIIDYIPSEYINLTIFIPFLLNLIAYSNYQGETGTEDIEEFTYPELETLIPQFQKLILRTKELIRNSNEDLKVFLEMSSFNGSTIIRVVLFEFLTEVNLDNNDINTFIGKITSNIKNEFLLFEILGLLYRAFPKSIEDQYDRLNERIILHIDAIDKLTPAQRDSLILLVYSFISYDESLATNYYRLCKAFIDSSLYVATLSLKIVYSQLSYNQQSKIRDRLHDKLADDGLNDSDKDSSSGLAKWNKIYQYWEIVFSISSSQFTKAAIAQLQNLVEDKIPPPAAAQFHPILEAMLSIFSDHSVIEYLIEAKRFEKLANILLKCFSKYNTLITDSLIEKIIKIFEYSTEIANNYIFNSFHDYEKSTVLMVIVSHPKAEKLRSLLSDNKIEANEDCIHMFTLSIDNIQYNSFISLISQDGSLFYKRQYFDTILKHYEEFKEKINDIIIHVVKEQRSSLTTFAEPIIEKYIKDENVHLDDIVINDFNDDPVLFNMYSDIVLVPFLKERKEAVYHPYKDHIHAYLYTALLTITNIPDYKFSSTESYDLFIKATCDEDRYIAIQIWSLSENDGHFLEMFKSLIDELNVHLSNQIKAACDNVRIPEGEDIEAIVQLLEGAVEKFIRYSVILVSIWTIISNNLKSFKTHYNRLWKLLTKQTANIRFYAKKTQLVSITPISELLTKIFTSNEILPHENHHAIVYFGSFLMQTLHSILESNNCNPRRCEPFIVYCIKMVKAFGSQICVANDYITLIIDYAGKSSQSKTPIYQQIFEILMQYVSKFVALMINFQPPFQFGPLVNILVENLKSSTSSIWPYAAYSMHLIISANICTDKLKIMYDDLTKDGTGLILFPLFWINSYMADIRLKNLLPFIIKCCGRDQQETPLNAFLINCAFRTMLDFQFGQTIPRLLTELNQHNRRFCSIFLSNLLSTPPKSKIESQYVLPVLKDPEICYFIPVILNEQDAKYNLSLYAKLAYCMQKETSKYVEEMPLYEINALYQAAKLIKAIHVPYAVLLSKSIPLPLSLQRILSLVKTINVKASGVIIDQVTKLSKWQEIKSVTETEEYDIADGKNILFQQEISPVATFMHHGMLNHALIAAKESLDSISKEDLMKIRHVDGNIPRFSLNFMKSEVPNYVDLNLSTISEIPSASQLSYTDKFCLLFLYSKFRVISAAIQDKNKKVTFKRPMNHFFPPYIHETFADLRKNASQLVTVTCKNEKLHQKMLLKSQRQNFLVDRPPLKSADELLEESSTNYKQLLYAFIPFIHQEEWREAFQDIAIKGLERSPNNDIFLALLLCLLKEKEFNFGDCLGVIPYRWSLSFALLHNRRIFSHLMRGFQIVSESLLLNTEENINFSNFLKSLTFKSTIVNGLLYFKNVPVPLADGNSTIHSILPIIDRESNKMSAFTIRDNEGKLIRYALTDKPVMEPDFALLMSCFSSLLNNFVDSRKRGQRLANHFSWQVSIGKFLTKTNAVPFVTDSKRWDSLFAYRLAALCSVQHFLSANFNLSDVLIDRQEGLISVSQLYQTNQIKFLVKEFIELSTIYGQFRAGLLSAGICFGYEIDKVTTFLIAILGLEKEEAEECKRRILNSSIANSDTTQEPNESCWSLVLSSLN